LCIIRIYAISGLADVVFYFDVLYFFFISHFRFTEFPQSSKEQDRA
jgi:hypothetical protein